MRKSGKRRKGRRKRAGLILSYAMLNLLTGPKLFDRVEALLPEHRERLFPPTETLSMFVAQVLSGEGRCCQMVDDAWVKRMIGVIGGLKPGRHEHT